MPAGLPVTWSSSDSSIATVDNGTVSGVSAGSCTITAEIEYEGVTYSDSASITVEGAEEWEIMYDLTSSGWLETTKWGKQDYQDPSRKTYVTYNEDESMLELVYNPEGINSTLYADCIYLNNNDVQAGDEWRLVVFGGMDIELGASISILTGALVNPDVYPVEDSAETIIPLTVNNPNHERLIAFQIRNGDNSWEYNSSNIIQMWLEKKV